MAGEVRFDDRVIVVTGAGGGLGEEYARLMAERGARVVVNDVGIDKDGSGGSPERAEAVVAAIVAKGGEAIADASDVCAPGAGEAAIGAAVQAWGRVDGLINNAGYINGSFDDMLAVHVKGAVSLIKAAWPHMREAGYGRIVNTVSAAGLFGLPGARAYATAKAGLVGLTKTLAGEGRRDGILVNALAPAAITRLTDANRDGWLGQTCPPALVAPATAWLVHEGCTVTGEVFSAGAGRMARVFTGEAPGYQTAELTLEDVRDHFDDVMATDGFAVPRSAPDEMRLFGWSPSEQQRRSDRGTT